MKKVQLMGLKAVKGAAYWWEDWHSGNKRPRDNRTEKDGCPCPDGFQERVTRHLGIEILDQSRNQGIHRKDNLDRRHSQMGWRRETRIDFPILRRQICEELFSSFLLPLKRDLPFGPKIVRQYWKVNGVKNVFCITGNTYRPSLSPRFVVSRLDQGRGSLKYATERFLVLTKPALLARKTGARNHEAIADNFQRPK